jgi:capsular exopolysaccharide synthesis family protein
VAYAQAEKRTLLVDADMRRPRIHKIFNLENDEGLSIYLAGASEDIKARRAGDLENLRIIPSGPAPPNPSELLGNSRFSRFLKLAGQKYDMIIFDSPPVLTVSDSLILSKLADGTLIVARAGKATNEIIEKGLQVLGDIQANIFGFVLNDVVYKKSNYYYYHQYYDSYYSSDKD